MTEENTLFEWGHNVSPPFVAAAIYLGRDWSSFAYSLFIDHKDHPMEVTMCRILTFQGQGGSYRTESTILLDNNKKIHSFGDEAETHYAKLQEIGGENWYYFTKFTSVLYDKTGLFCDCKLKDIKGRELPAVDVFAAAILYMKSRIMDYDCFTEGDIHWVILVPDVSNNTSTKEVLTESAIKAGIQKETLSLTAESEAAFMCCEHRYTDSTGKNRHKPGSKHLLVNASETTYLSVLEVQKNFTVKNLKLYTEDSGLDQVYGEWKLLLTAISGESFIKHFYERYPESVTEMHSELDIKIRWLQRPSNRIFIKIPVDLHEAYRETGEDLKKAVMRSEYAGKVSFVSDKIQMNVDVYKGMFQVSIDDTINIIRLILKDNNQIETIMMVGFFSNLVYLQNRVREVFPGVECIFPKNPEFASLVGAVKLGHTDKFVSQPVSKYTYGFSTHRKFNPKIHPAGKKITINNRVYCKDVFEKHAEIGELLCPSNPQCDKVYKPLQAGQTSLEFALFASYDKDPVFVTDEGCFQIGKVEVNLDKNHDREILINVKIYYGDTELKVEAQDVRENIKYHTKVSVDSFP